MSFIIILSIKMYFPAFLLKVYYTTTTLLCQDKMAKYKKAVRASTDGL